MNGLQMRSVIACVAIAFTLGACAKRSEPLPLAGMSEDDDTFCRAKGATIGSAEYVACRKDRDVQRSNAVVRADRTQRNLGEMMLNKPEDGPRRGF